MIDPAPNHLHIYRDRRGKHITLDGHELLLDGEDPLLITGVENQEEITRVMLTLLAPKITIDPETEDQEPETATVDAPEPTLAEELRDLGSLLEDEGGAGAKSTCWARDLAARAEQIEQERDQARAEVGRLNAERTSKESLQVDQPDPADVPYGEAWLVEWKGRRHTAVRVPEQYWWVWRSDRGYATTAWCSDITLITRLVPAPCVITNHDELDRMPEGTIIRDNRDGIACQKNHHGFWDTTMGDDTAAYDDSTFGPATVLWTPEETK